MMAEAAGVGIENLDKLNWGSHLCHFYKNQNEIETLLLNFIKKGLKKNDFCLIITSDPLKKEQVEKIINKKISGYNKNQIEIISYKNFYLEKNNFDKKDIVKKCKKYISKSLKNDFNGVRIFSNLGWLNKKYWKDFNEYEKQITSLLKNQKVIAFCAYNKNNHSLSQIVEISRTHPTIVLKENNDWKFIKCLYRKKAAEQLKNSESRYQNLFETMAQGVVYQDTDGEIISVNPAAEEILGRNLDEMQGKTSRDDSWKAIREDGSDFPGDKHPAMLSLKTGKPVKNTVMGVFNPKEERYRWINVNAIPEFKDGEKNPYQVYTTFDDITYKKDFQDNLVIKEKAIDSSINAIAITDLSGNITYVNDSFMKLWGYDDKEQVLGKPMIKFWKLKGKYVDIIDSLTEKGGWTGELMAEKKNDKHLNVLVSATMVKNLKNKPVCMMASFVDITQRKKVEKEIRKTKEYLQNIIDSASEIIICLDENYKVSIWNKTAEEITGYKKRSILGKKINKIHAFKDKKKIKQLLKTNFEGHRPGNEKIILKTKDGSDKLIQISSSAVRTDKNDASSVLLIGRDVTYQKEDQGKLIKGNSYISIEKNNEEALMLFSELAKSGHKGLIVTRENPELIKSRVIKTKSEIFILNEEKTSRFKNIKDLDELIEKIRIFSDKNKKSVVLLDRIDYLIIMFSFSDFLKTLYKINNIIMNTKSLLLINVNPDFLDNKQIALLESELKNLPSKRIKDLSLDEKVFKILEFIDEECSRNIVVTFKKISRHFSIVKATTAKRLRILEDNDLINIRKKGRSKVINVTRKGKVLLKKRSVF